MEREKESCREKGATLFSAIYDGLLVLSAVRAVGAEALVGEIELSVLNRITRNKFR